MHCLRLWCRSVNYYRNSSIFVDCRRSYSKIVGPQTDPNEDFAVQFRKSKFVQLGDPNGKIVAGRITRVVKHDLYIDFGGKFPCICKRPSVDGELYTVGRTVRIRLHDLELSTRFLGSELDMSLLEADATLLGLFRTKAEVERQQAHRQKTSTDSAPNDDIIINVKEEETVFKDSEKQPKSSDKIDFSELLKTTEIVSNKKEE